ncbi:MAG: hypothetical protein LBH28_11745 [Oscillospiraceae bacterium]|nr:hypothetical protein [Oscillospiraceae bacterium]
MDKLFSNEKIRFFAKVMAAHVVTYIVCGLAAFNLFGYGDFTELIGFRPMEEISAAMMAFGQILRGLLFGFAIWWIRGSIIGKKFGWLKLWGVLIILGIFNTYGPNTGSIEGMIYLDLSNFEDVPVSGLLSFIEITLQPLLFSLIVTYQRKKRVIVEMVA